MTKIQDHVMQLMREIDETCAKNHLPYALYGRTAGCAIKDGGFTTQCYEFRIMMQAGDIIILKEKLSQKYKKDRGFEDFSMNPDLQYHYVRYVNTRSTVIDKNNPVSYRMPGAAVTIIPLYTQQISRLCEVLETGFIYLNGGRIFDERDESEEAERVKTCIKMTKMLVKVFGKKWAANRIYQSLVKEKGKRNKEKLIFRGDADSQYADLRKTFNAGYIYNTRRIPFAGMELPVPVEAEKFFKRVYGLEWKIISVTPYQTVNSMNVIWDDYVPFSEYIEMMKEEGVDIYKVFEDERKLLYYQKNTYEPWEEKAFRYLYHAKRSVKRIDIYCDYLSKMKDIRKAAKEGDIKQLKTLMKRYLRTVERYRKLGVEFYINDELHRYASLVWDQTKSKKEYSEEIYSMTPEIYKKKDMGKFLADYI